MKSQPLAALAALAIAATPLAAQAPPDTFRLEQITVTATKVPAPLAALPAHITVITGEQLRAGGQARVLDALRGQAGVSAVQLGAPGAVASLFLRGGESDYVQVLVDGVQVNDPGGAYDWAHLTAADIDRIELVRGPASVLYGSDAAAGVVQIFTRRGAGRTRVRSEVTAGLGQRVGAGADGTFGTWSGSVSAAGGGAAGRQLDASYSLSAARAHSDGVYAFNNRYGNTTLAGRFDLAGRGGTLLDLTARYTDQRFHYPTDGAGNIVDRNRFTRGDALAAGLRLERPLGPRLAARLSLGVYRNRTGADDPEDEPGDGFQQSRAEVAREQLELRLDARPAAGLTVSAGGELERLRGTTAFESDGPFGPYTSASDDRRANRAAFAQLLHAGPRLGVTAGVRIDHSDQFGSFGTFRAGLGYRLLPELRVHAALGTGFKEPTFMETYATGFAIGNPELQPEQTRSAEAGVQAGGTRTSIALTAFRQSFRNLIQYTFAPPAAGDANYFNIGRARAQGIELEAGATLHRTLTASTGYTWLSTAVIDAGFGEDRQFVEGESLLRRPGHRLSGTLTWRTERASASLQADHTGSRADLDFTDPVEWQGRRVRLDPYTTLGASFRYRLPVRRGDLEASLHVRNLLDAAYEEVYNFPAAGRVLTLGVSVTR